MSENWYDTHWRQQETPEFVSWWIGEYGNPEDYDEVEYEQDEYWVRKGFALMGWHGAMEQMKKEGKR